MNPAENRNPSSPGRTTPGPPVTPAQDDISERYLAKAIAEMNDLGHEIAEAAGSERVAVLGSGHPQADIFLLKHRPQTAELHEGVAFFGRTGQAILKSLQRLRVDPMAIYGTNAVKYDGQADEEAAAMLRRELHVVQPKLVVAMGQDALSCLNAAQFPLARALEGRMGEMQPFTPTIEALVTPDIDTALDEAPTKRAFWNAFKAIGPWWSEQPPY
jgi:uracil-DNA glycosylase family 4